MTSSDEFLAQAADYFGAQLAKHGTTPRGADWNERSVEQRHRQFLRLIGDDPGASVLDLGCGYADFFRFIRQHGFKGRYIGYDLLPAMIEAARRLHGEGEDHEFHVGIVPQQTADYATASGVLARKGDVSVEKWREFVWETIDLLARLGRKGFAFNIVTSINDPDRRRADLYYADPVEMLDHCIKRFGRSVALLQDYGLYEFTVIVRHPV